MRTIYKYPLSLTDRQIIAIVGNTGRYTVGLDPKGEPCIWALVYPEQKEVTNQVFIVVGTGYPVPYDARVWVGSVTQDSFVWHIFTP